ncbi:N(6)-adenine-specific methyltransferase METTL4 isoform X1 [Diabrotica undecimpunctata]|uniref:N(6)-adenine-specific methyltransferase METTL4 isoform X1 n=1 Tax=Diabrotica undecimpunctata TaxID=50387 RepID=UPI003B636B8D
MSKIFENESGCLISHEKFINGIYKELLDLSGRSYHINQNLFKINTTYKTSRQSKSKRSKNVQPRNGFEDHIKEQNVVKFKYNNFLAECSKYFINNNEELQSLTNNLALEAADVIQNDSGNSVLDMNGANDGPAVVNEINGSKYVFPEKCEFYCKNVLDMEKHLSSRQFDLILLDPPWWNKYIRRKRKKSSDGYSMMYNEDLKNLPIGDLLSDEGLVAVWCTNSKQNLDALLNEVFPKWNVQFTAKWFWLKVTTRGEPICPFFDPPGKQPYEKLVFGHRNRTTLLPEDGKLLLSVPSALHSHKPPLVDVLKEYLPENPRCLEVFARYLLPNWTSYGNEVIKLQHESLFVLK